MKLKLNRYLITYFFLLIVFIVPYFMFESFEAPSIYEYSADYNLSVIIKTFYLIILYNYFVLLTSLLINVKNKYLEKNKVLLSLLSFPALLAVLYSMFVLTDISFLGGYERMVDSMMEYPFNYIQVSFYISNWTIRILIFCYLLLGIFGVYYETADKNEGKIIEKISLRYIFIFILSYIFLNVVIKAMTIVMIP